MRAILSTFAFWAVVAWLANWTLHATMAPERPLAVDGAVCGKASAPAPYAVCLLCEDALAASAGPVQAPDFTGRVATRAPPRA